MLRKKNIDGKTIWEKEENLIYEPEILLKSLDSMEFSVMEAYKTELSDGIYLYTGLPMNLSKKARELAMTYAENSSKGRVPLGGYSGEEGLLFVITCALSDFIKSHRIKNKIIKVKSNNSIEDRLVQEVFGDDYVW